MIKLRLFTLSITLALGTLVTAADQAAPKPTMTVPGKALLTDKLDGPLGGKWKAAKGKWDNVDGATRGRELKEDMHGAVIRHNVDFQNAFIQYDFKLDGPKLTSFSINGPKGHICRVKVSPTEFSVVKDDQDGKDGPDKAATLGKADLKFVPGQWYTMTIEIVGQEMLAKVGDQIAYGSHEKLDQKKTNIGFTVSGEYLTVKNLTISEATVKPDWEKTKASVLPKK